MEGSNPSCYQAKATRKNVVFCFIKLSFIIIVTDVIYFIIMTEKYDRKQHLSFGIITGIAFSAYLHKLSICQNNADMVFVVCGSVLGSLLPDIDSTESIISNILPPFTTLTSKIINNVFGHRGLLHYSLFWIVMAFFTANYNHFTQGLFFGVFGHLFLDACTYKGIPAFLWIIDRSKTFYVFPKKWKMYVGKRRTNIVFYIFVALVTSGIIFLTMH